MAAAAPTGTANWSAGNARFDKQAAAWDSKPETIESSQAAYQALLKHVPPLSDPSEASSWSVLEIGCGTGLLSLQIAPHVNELVGVDTSQGMIDMLTAKALRDGLAQSGKVTAIKVLLEDADDPVLQGKRFQLVISHLVFHHIPRMKDTIAVMARALAPGGMLIISDFEDDGPHARRFHPKDKHGGVERHGLLRAEMLQLLGDEAQRSGLKDVRVFESFALEKMTAQEDGRANKERYPFIFCMATKG
ncbi:S-adenosyl-L-methionine-dependent methyltransferase [Tilletiaria anomala UBC 951]|uniref:S-adenosyl-L-methionine-dependent methyltransferase n=1 Tax=Tilletiaria anomala (strain ATCC 24038 / CBS 436.72 / UBC 951) TaxID=1037660 RepID=A0A066VVF3_TILAU|nr:S-adenosyl-L-methionine-dependent methyltransferase [Tilletiaria anomala UBC 951]KDN45451.1 S-adenosyl-L-methionine-dependent methyltransferase [Tilletiaria anomala UBC 951]